MPKYKMKQKNYNERKKKVSTFGVTTISYFEHKI